jgi:hypothetical protein
VPIRSQRPRSVSRSGWLFGAVTVLPALLVAAWLLPGLPLLLAGRFAGLPVLFMFAPLAVGLCYFAMRQLPASWPAAARAAEDLAAASRAAERPATEDLAAASRPAAARAVKYPAAK